MVIPFALKRDDGHAGSYSSVYRMIAAVRAALPGDTTVPLAFAPGEAAQVDFGAGPVLVDPATIDGLSQLVGPMLKGDAFSGSLFVFLLRCSLKIVRV